MTLPVYLVALPITPFVIGPYIGKSSLQCTLMHWFTLSDHLSECVLRKWLRAYGFEMVKQQIELVSVEKALFGPDSDVPVYVLEKNETLMNQHNNLLDFLYTHRCGLPRPDWIGENYRPHVTVSKERIFVTGSRHVVTSLSLIRRLPDGSKEVIFQLSW